MLNSAAQSPRFHLPTFDGPLDLLLHLIRENEIDIYDIPIAEITQQYLDYLSLMEQFDLAVAGEYLVIAATLLEIKSRMLLPQAPKTKTGEDEEEDPRAELVQRLLEYQKFRGSVETLKGWEEFRQRIFFRGALENPEDYLLPVPAGNIHPMELLEALKKALLAAGVQDTNVTAVTPRRRVSLRMKMAELMNKIRACPEGLPFAAALESPAFLYDIVLLFLAMLELLRQGMIQAEQMSLEEDILLTLHEREDAA
jgi:segregation and condensation protein A